MKKNTLVFWLIVFSAIITTIILIIRVKKIDDKMIKEYQEGTKIQMVEDYELTTTQTSTQTTTTTTTAKKTTQKTTKKVQDKFTKVENASKGEYMAYAKAISGYNDTEMKCLDYLWEHESNWNPNSSNAERDVCGIPQSHPCNKIIKQQGSYDWQAQIRWGINHINYNYKNPCSAWNHWKNSRPHSY